MLGNYFYNKGISKTVIAFGTLFNNIQIRHVDESDNPVSVLKVPLAYGPTQKFLARIEQNPSGDRKIALTLPRMSFEMVSIDYDATRKASTIQTFKSAEVTDGTQSRRVYMPVPYNLGFELNIMAKMQPQKIVYISCDPATLARDVKILTDLGYSTNKAYPVDMFPRTPHVEVVTLLSRE